MTELMKKKIENENVSIIKESAKFLNIMLSCPNYNIIAFLLSNCDILHKIGHLYEWNHQ